MKITKKQTLIFLLLLSLFLIQISGIMSVPKANAENLWDMQKESMKEIGTKFGETGEPTDIREIIVNIIKVLLTVIGIIFFIMILWSGYKWMISRGNENEISEAKSQLKSAIIGFVIITTSYVIVDFVADCVLDITKGETIWMCK